MLENIFIALSSILALLLIIYKVFVCKIKQNPKISVYVSIITGVLFLYILFALMLSVTSVGIVNRVIILLLGLSPFIIGKLATYKKENLFSWIQIFVIILGVVYILVK